MRVGDLRRGRRLLPLLVPGLLFLSWYVVTHRGLVDAVFLPSPDAIGQRLVEDRKQLWTGLQASLAMIFWGFLLGGSLGVLLGLLLGYSRLAREVVEFTVDLARPVPLLALIPLFILWFGIGTAPQVAVVAIGVFLIISLTTVEAARNVPRIYLRAAAVSGATRAQAYRTVVIPAILPHTLGGVRLAVASAWGLDVAAELTGSQTGLGYLMTVRQQYLDTAGVLSIVLIFCVLAIVADRLLQYLNRRAARWNAATARQSS